MEKRKNSPKITNPNFIPSNRRWNVVKKHAPIVIKSIFIATLCVLFWRYILYPLNLHFSKHANDIILFMVSPIIGTGYVLFAAIAVNSAFDQFKIISRSVVRNEKDEFLTYRDEQLPIKIHLLIGVPSIIILFFTLSFNYESDIFIGAAAIFTISFMLTLAWKIAADLDNFQNSVWFQQRVPKEWYEANIHDHFYKNKK